MLHKTRLTGGDIFNPKNTGIIFQANLLQLKPRDFVEAIVMVFKITYVLNLEFTENTHNFWEFVEV